MQSSTSSMIALVASLAALAAAQSSPAPTSTGMPATSSVIALPFFAPFAQTIGASAVSADPNGNQYVLAVTCLDGGSCPQPSTGTYTVGISTLDWKAPFAWHCDITSFAPNVDVPCTLSADGSTNVRTDQLSTMLPATAPDQGVARPVTVTAGLEKLSADAGATSSSGSGSASASPTSSSSSSASRSGSGSTTSASASASSSASHSGSASGASASGASASASATAGAERMIAGTGILGAAALLVGAIVA